MNKSLIASLALTSALAVALAIHPSGSTALSRSDALAFSLAGTGSIKVGEGISDCRIGPPSRCAFARYATAGTPLSLLRRLADEGVVMDGTCLREVTCSGVLDAADGRYEVEFPAKPTSSNGSGFLWLEVRKATS